MSCTPPTITPSEEVIVTGPTTFELRPAPGTLLYTTPPALRTGTQPLLYETLGPAPIPPATVGTGISIECVATGIAPPIPPGTPHVILSMTMTPGLAVGSGPGCTIITSNGAQDIPEMQLPVFSEPNIQYGSLSFGSGVPTAILPNALSGFYSEKYFHDQEYIFATYYKTQAPNRVDKYTLVDLINGNKVLTREAFDALPQQGRIIADMFPGAGTTVPFLGLAIDDSEDVLTSGTEYLDSITNDVTAWIKFKPSEISVIRFYYTLTVTTNCPPFTHVFTGHMDVSNNWDPAQNRLDYYLNKGIGIIPDPE